MYVDLTIYGEVKHVFCGVGCGVTFQVPGTRWAINGEVLDLDEVAQTIKVGGADFEGWIRQAQITNVISPSEYVLDNAINVIGDDGS